MENKYYTPSIEEFHVGFEFEYFDNGEWNKNKLDFDDIVSPPGLDDNSTQPFYWKSYINLKGRFRVKNLDQSDIEELFIPLGFYKDPNPFSGCCYINGSYLESNSISVSLEPETNLLQITRYNYFIRSNGREYTSSNLFYGLIKNKSELKRLMKQLGIEN